MHKRGVSLVLSLIITANLIPTNLVQAHADEINTNSEVIVDENVLGETPEIEDVKRNEEVSTSTETNDILEDTSDDIQEDKEEIITEKDAKDAIVSVENNSVIDTAESEKKTEHGISIVYFSGDSLPDNAVVKVGKDYTHKATLAVSGIEGDILYSGVDKHGIAYLSKQKPTKEGVYTAAVYSPTDPLHTVVLSVRHFTITKFLTETDVVAPDKVYDGKEYVPTTIVKDKVGEVVENANIEYTYYKGETKLESAPTEVGSYRVVAEFKGDDAHYKSKDEVNFNIIKADVTINIDNAEKVYGDADPDEFTYSVNGLVEGDTINVELTRSEGESVGTYDINVASTDLNLDNYNYSVNPGVFTIKKAQLQVNIEDATKICGEEDPEFKYTVDGLVGDDNVEFELVREEGEDVGEYTITVVDKELENYNYNVNEGTLTIKDDTTTNTEKPNTEKPNTENPKTSDIGVGGFAGMGMAALAGLFVNRKKRSK